MICKQSLQVGYGHITHSKDQRVAMVIHYYYGIIFDILESVLTPVSKFKSYKYIQYKYRSNELMSIIMCICQCVCIHIRYYES